MGNQLNQLTCAAPAQINPVEFYLSQISDIKFDKSLGSTRFFKVARIRWRNGYFVVKVFVIQDQQILPSLKKIENCLRIEKETLYNPAESNLSSNCLYYNQVQLTDRAALLIRPYVYANLHDRLNIRPYLVDAEKRWIAYQLLAALSQAHSKHIVHGDVKAENVLLTSFGWLLLADFAVHFKPATLPVDNPANFNFFFDTSRRRTCAVAPERFVGQTDGSELQTERDLALGLSASAANMARRILAGSPQRDVVGSSSGSMTSSTNDGARGAGEIDVGSAADLFSAGCVIAQLFADAAPFTYPQALQYRTGRCDALVQGTLGRIGDPHMRALVGALLSRNVAERRTAAQHMETQRGRAFPDYYYSFMHRYFMKVAARNSSADETVMKLLNDFDKIVTRLRAGCDARTYNLDLLPFLALLTSACRFCRTCGAKRAALSLLLSFVTHLPTATVLDRIVPFELCFAVDRNARVRAHCVRVVAATFQCVTQRSEPVPTADKNIFLDLVLPALEHLVKDRSTLVQIAFARCLAPLAESALVLLDSARRVALQRLVDRHAAPQHSPNSDYSPTNDASMSPPPSDEADDDFGSVQTAFENDLRTLRNTIGSYVYALLLSTSYSVRIAFLTESVMRLCRFLGTPRTTDLLLAHIVTFLNDKRDWRLRCIFYKRLFEIVAYTGAPAADYVRSLLPQGLNDADERVVYEATRTCARLAQLGVLDSVLLRELLTDTVPLVLHPNSWIRHAAVAFCSAAARRASVADRFIYMLPKLRPFLAVQLAQLDDARLLERALLTPLSRAFFDQLMRLRLGDLTDFLKLLTAQRELDPNQAPAGPTLASERFAEARRNRTMLEFHTKLRKQGLEALDERKIALMDNTLQRLYSARMSSPASASDEVHNIQSAYATALADNAGTISLKDANRLIDMDDTNLDSQSTTAKTGAARIPVRRINVKNTSPMQNSIVSMQSGSTMLVDTPNDPPLLAGTRALKAQPATRGNEEWKTMFEAQPTETIAPRSQPVAIPRRLDADMGASGGSSLPLSPARSQPRRTGSSPKTSFTQSATAGPKDASPNLTTSTLHSATDAAAEVAPHESASLDSTGSAQSAASCSCTSPAGSRTQVRTILSNNCSCILLRAAFLRAETRRRQLAAHEFSALRRAVDPPEQATLSYGWRPRGTLCGHFAEHSGAVNRVTVCDAQPSSGSQFATCADDGTIRLWQFGLRDFDLMPNRSSAIWRSSAPVRGVEFAGADRELLVAFDTTGRIFRLASLTGCSSPLLVRDPAPLADSGSGGVSSFTTDPLVDGRLVDLRTMHDAAHCCIVYATTNGYLVVQDLRSQRPAYRLANPLRLGLPTCLDVHRSNLWMVAGTASGTCVLWDLRFRLPVQTYPDIVSTGSSSVMVASGTQPNAHLVPDTHAKRSAAHARVSCAVIDAIGTDAPQLISATRAGNNDVSIWDLESAMRRRVLSTDPSGTPSSSIANRVVHSMCVGYVQLNSNKPPSHVLITGGSDQFLRFWDLNTPSSNSYVIAPPGTRSPSARQLRTIYRVSATDGVETVSEIIEPDSVPTGGVAPTHLDSLQPVVGHIDTISSVALLKPVNYTHQCFILSASRDGVVKIWK